MEFCMAVYNYGIKIKETRGSALEVVRVPCRPMKFENIKSCTK
jgi:hypothetical protein